MKDFVKKYFEYLLLGGAAFFLLLNFALMAAPGTKVIYGNNQQVYSVYEWIGGINGQVSGDAAAIIGLILTIVLIVCAAGLAAIKFLGIKIDFLKWIVLGVAVLALVAAIMFFCVKASCDSDYKQLCGEYLHLGAGAVFCGIFSLIAAGAFGAYAAKLLLNK